MDRFFIVSMPRAPTLIGNRSRVYKGIDRAPWKCVDDLYYAKKLPSDLLRIRENSFKNYVGNLSFGTVTKEDAITLLSICEQNGSGGQVIEVVEVSAERGEPIHVEAENARLLGIDGYVDGYGSIVRLGIFEKAEPFRVFHDSINENGLFQNIDAMKRYSKLYADIGAREGLEPIEELDLVKLYAVLQS